MNFNFLIYYYIITIFLFTGSYLILYPQTKKGAGMTKEYKKILITASLLMFVFGILLYIFKFVYVHINLFFYVLGFGVAVLLVFLILFIYLTAREKIAVTR